MDSIKVSIIIPVYNSAATLERCIESLLSQTLCATEIIAVDDGSDDESHHILHAYSTKYPEKFLLIREKRSGTAAARNHGIVQAHGEYVGFVDSDDYVDQTMFEKLYSFAHAENLDIAVCKRFEVRGASLEEQVFRSALQSVQLVEVQDTGQLSLLIENLSGFVWDKLYRRELLKNSVKFSAELHYAEDVHLVGRCLYYCKRVGFLDEPLYYYDKRISTIALGELNEGRSESQLDIFVALQGLVDFYRNKGIFPEVEVGLCRLSIGYFNRRLRSLRKYHATKDRRAKTRFVEQALHFFNANFSNWKTELRKSGKNSSNWFKTCLPLLKLYISLPEGLKGLLRPAIRLLRKP